MTNNPRWQEWEQKVNKDLGLDGTISSGNKWHDPGDGVDRSHYTEEIFPLVVDAKYTEAHSFAVSQRVLYQWVKKAEEMGKRFILAVRLWPKGFALPEDYVVVPYNDFIEFREAYRELKSKTVTDYHLTENDIQFLEVLSQKLVVSQLRLKMVSIVSKIKGSGVV
jgi:hypothetical protein